MIGPTKGDNINLKIIKYKNEFGGERIKDVGFCVEVHRQYPDYEREYLGFDSKGNLVAVNYDQAYVWRTDSNGEINITGLTKDWSYRVCEVDLPGSVNNAKSTGAFWKLDKQIDKGLEVRINNQNCSANSKFYSGQYSNLHNGGISCGKVINYKDFGSNVKVEITNATGDYTPPVQTVSGIVWVDGPNSKPEYNAMCDSNEKRVSNVKVTLKKKSNNKQYTSGTTDSNGYYEFTGITMDIDLSEYYVEFNYKETKYSNYIPVERGETSNRSKALGGGGIAYTTKSASPSEENKYGITADKQGRNYKNVNCGLKPFTVQGGSITKSIAYVKIQLKGKTYIYYCDGIKSANSEGPTVSVGNYSRDLYASDIIYNQENKGELKVYIAYNITITNSETTYNDYMQEDGLAINSITDQVPTGCTVSSDPDNLIADKYWNQSGQYDFEKGPIKKGKSRKYESSKNEEWIGRGQSSTIYITLQLTDDKIAEVLNSKESKIENIVSFSGTQNYRVKEIVDYDDNGNPIYEWKPHTQSVNESSPAVGMTFKLHKDGEERTISGKVFEDLKDNTINEVKNNGEVLGNGKFDTGEKNAKDVQVQLLEWKDNKWNVAKIYNTDDKDKGKEATLTTNDEGSYEFKRCSSWKLSYKVYIWRPVLNKFVIQMEIQLM